MGPLKKINYDLSQHGKLPHERDTDEMILSLKDILLVCSIFCSSDIIAAVTIIKFEDQPKLFSIILGEGLNNDAVAIILY